MGAFIVPSGDAGAPLRPRRRLSPVIVVAAVVALAAGLFAPGLADPAVADTAPVAPTDPRTPETVSTDVLPTPQIGDGTSSAKGDTKGSGVVWDQVVIGDTVYVGGSFQFARPAGAAAGEKVVPRSNFLAYNLKTGALLDYAPAFNGVVRSLAVSVDQKTLYVGGVFTAVDGATRYRLAAFDVASGALTSFAPTINASVWTLAVSKTTVYAAGGFTSVQKTARSGLAAFSTSNAAVTAWAPVAATGTVQALLVSPDESKVIVGGRFTTLNGSNNPGHSMGAVRADTGASLPWKVNALIRNGGLNSGITALASKGGSVYGTAFLADGNEGNFEGTFRASWADGTIEWIADCHGDSYSVAVSDTAVYSTSHAHSCDGVGGFPEGTKSATSNIWHRALAFSIAKTQTLRPWTTAPYGNFGGQPSPSLLDWYPDVAAGTFTGLNQAAWDVTTAQGYVLLGGEFPTVNGVKQQGLVRFAPKSAAPNKDGPQLEKASMVPTVSNWGNSYAKLSWPANYDRDNASLTYQVIRDGNAAKPVFQTTVESRFWQRPTVTAMDGYLTPGKTYSYQIRTIDPLGNVKWGNAVSYTAPATTTWSPGYITTYDKTVLQDQPASYWSMNEPGEYAYDWARDNNHVHAVAAPRVAGPEPATASATSSAANYAAGGWSASLTVLPAPQVFTAEAWVKTTSKAGGQIVGYGDSRASSVVARDRIVFMAPDGRLGFYVYNGVGNTIYSTKSYNDGSWHSVSGSLSEAGMKLYVDGAEVATQPAVTSAYVYPSGGYWQIGGRDVVSANMLTAAVDNVAIYHRVLSAAQIAAHYAAANAPKPNVAPVSSFTSSVKDLAVSVDGAGSKDSDGSIASYAWDFGDGSTGSGKTASHTYAKAGGYTVKLTVTDDRGATNASSNAVTVTAPGAPQPSALASDAFSRSVATGWGEASPGGAWTQSRSGGGTSVASDAGAMVFAKGETRTMMLPAVSSDSSDTRVSFAIGTAPTGGGQAVSVIGRQVGSESYFARVLVQSNGVLQLQVQRSGVTLKAVNLTGVTYQAGQKVFVRFQVTGKGTTTLNAKAWTTGAEPGAWQVTATDTTAALQAPGSVGLSGYLSSSAAAGATFTFDEYGVARVS